MTAAINVHVLILESLRALRWPVASTRSLTALRVTLSSNSTKRRINANPVNFRRARIHAVPSRPSHLWASFSAADTPRRTAKATWTVVAVMQRTTIEMAPKLSVFPQTPKRHYHRLFPKHLVTALWILIRFVVTAKNTKMAVELHVRVTMSQIALLDLAKPPWVILTLCTWL